MFLVTLLACSVAALGQKSSLSPRAAMLLKQMENGKLNLESRNGCRFVRSQGVACVPAFAML